MLNKYLLCLVALTWLAACSQDPESPPPAESAAVPTPATELPATSEAEPDAAPSAELALDDLAEDPEALRQAMRDPDQRQALMEAMRERRQARQGEGAAEDVDREAMRERMRERREQMMAERDQGRNGAMRERMMQRNQWWADESLRDSIGLSEAQSEALSERQAGLEAERMAAQQALGANQRALMNALRAGDRNQVMTLLDEREAAAQSAQALENQWWRILLDELTDEQIQTLAEEHPQLILGRRGR